MDTRDILKAIGIVKTFARYKMGRPKPLFVSYQITLRCNRRCVFCNVWKVRVHEELSTEQAKHVVGELANYGIPLIGITGGEPLVRNDLEAIAQYGKSRGAFIGLNTNATLMTRERAVSIARSFDGVFVSLDGFSATHDGIRGEQGSFDAAIVGLKNLLRVRRNCLVGVNFVLTKRNYKELVNFARWLQDLGVVLSFFPVTTEDGLPYQELSVPEEEINSLLGNAMKLKIENPSLLEPSVNMIELMRKFLNNKMPRLCDAGRLYLGVNPKGELRICPIGLPEPEWTIGSLVESNIQEMLRSKRFREALGKRANCGPCLGGCTTPHSLLFRSSISYALKESLKYWRVLNVRPFS
jgi:MoaA/NifB/PqqE/SkfB family radical SAM enzyme